MPRRLPTLLLLFATTANLSSASAQLQSRDPQANSIVTLKTNSNLVVVDVVVTDKSGNSVRNLQRSDFALEENGATQQIRNFEEHQASPKLDPLFLPNLPANVFTNFTPAPPSGALNILLIDTLNTPMQDQVYLRAQLLKYLKADHPGTRTAIFALTNAYLSLLQSFTTDPKLIQAAINKKGVRASPLTNDSLAGSSPDTMSQQVIDRAEGPGGGGASGEAQRAVAFMKQREVEQDALQTDMRAKYTLNALSQLARYLSIIPGRKNLIWFSGSFPISVMPVAPESPGSRTNIIPVQNAFAGVASSEVQFRYTTNLLSRSQVSVYPVDARGIVGTQDFGFGQPMQSANSIGPRYESNQQSNAFSTLVAEQSTMREMAYQTGGKAFINTNDLSGAADEAIRNGSSYYSLSYSPTDNNYNGKFRKIQIQLQQKGLTLAYRRGYYADDPTHTDHDQNKPLPTATDSIHLAMMWGTPEPTEIIFKASVLAAAPASAAPEPTLAAGTFPGPNPNRSRGPYRNYTIDLAALSRTVSFKVTPDGHHHANLEVLTIAFDRDGTVVTNTGNTISIDAPTDEFVQQYRGGIQAHQQISVPAKGDYTLRIGIHDLLTDRVGAIQVPLRDLKNPFPAIKTISVPTTPEKPDPTSSSK